LDKNYSFWYAANTYLSLMPLGKVRGISTKNLLYPLNNEELNSGYRMGNSNSVVMDGIVTIEHQSGDLLLMECID
jgi:thiamine pyrophosphokinase